MTDRAIEPAAGPGLALRPHAGGRTPAAAGAGIAAGIAALAVPELIAGLIPGAPSLVLSVGALVIDLQPPGAKDLVVALFGEADKLALEVGIVGVALLIAAGLGIAGLRRFWLAALGFGLAGVVGAIAALGDPQVTPTLAMISASVAAGVGIGVLDWLLGSIRGPDVAAASAAGHVVDVADPAGGPATDSMPDWSRRSLLIRSGAVAVGSIAAGLIGRTLLERQRIVPDGAAVLPPPAVVVDLPAGSELDVAGITPLVVPNDRFYRIDTALIVPRVDIETWSLRIHGLVERETRLDWRELTALPTFEQYVTIACVSNEVGGNLVGNAKWTGVRLREVLEIAGVRPEASQLVGRSVDGFTAGMPTAWVMDPGREPMIAIAMNDEPLPTAHGYPARLIIPGLYGYVSATKWLAELELTTMEDFDGYWIPLGWAKEAPILTQSRIDVPRSGATLAPGRNVAAGVAWAPDRGISAVEVQLDDGPWLPAEISRPISDATWVQWRAPFDATETGGHILRVRATDGDGEVQTERTTSPPPSGARGRHSVVISIRA
jgi:DMSO/TMAO reductase YedYZ molybdopterin-dependent catalytic subunit